MSTDDSRHGTPTIRKSPARRISFKSIFVRPAMTLVNELREQLIQLF